MGANASRLIHVYMDIIPMWVCRYTFQVFPPAVVAPLLAANNQKQKNKPNRKKKRYRPGGLIGCPVAVREEPPAAAESLAGARTAAWSAPARSATGEQAVLSAVPVSSLRA